MKKNLSLFFVLVFAATLFTSVSSLAADTKDTGCCKSTTVKCPVSGEVIARDAMTITTDYQGKTYYFCCENCKAEFIKNPEKYTKESACKTHYTCTAPGCQFKSANPGKCPTHGAELKKHECSPVYVCPMESCNTQSDKPGKCPKCGMEMKKKDCTCKTEKKCDSAKKEEQQ